MPFLTNAPLPQCLQHSSATPCLLARDHDRGCMRYLLEVKCLQIRGQADSIHDGVAFYANKVNLLLKILALATNAWVDDIRCEIVFEVTEGVTRREYLQMLVP